MKKSLVKSLDTLWSQTVRNRDGLCVRHITSGHCVKLDAHHIVSKSLSILLRWDVINGVSLGAHCHRWNDNSAHSNKHGFEKWFKRTHLVKWKYLQRQKKKSFQFKDFHYETVRDAIINQTPLGDIL